MILWHPTAQHDILPDAGSFLGGPYRGVLHTTEGDSYAGALGAYRATGNGPHFTKWLGGLAQHVALDRAATALKHPAGTVETNRLSAIQIEVVGHAATSPSWSAQLVAELRDLMIWIEDQTGIAPVAPAFLPYPQSAGNTSVRFPAAAWARFGGWCGHEHVPFNDHGDPGALPIGALLTRGVQPMYSPPLQIVAELDCPTGGVWCLGPDGSIYAWGGAPYLGGANGKPYFAGRTAARLNLVDGKYQIVDVTGATYGPGF